MLQGKTLRRAGQGALHFLFFKFLFKIVHPFSADVSQTDLSEAMSWRVQELRVVTPKLHNA
jgi:hypothetical protein